MARLISRPAAASSPSRTFFSIGTHDPHVVPARVQLFSAGTVSASPVRTADRTVPTVMPLQVHNGAESGKVEVLTGVRFAGRTRSSGAPGSTPPFDARLRMAAYCPTSPTSTAPSTRLPSSDVTSFAYRPATGSA